MNTSDPSDERERSAEKIDFVSKDSEFENNDEVGIVINQLSSPVKADQQQLPVKLFRNETSGVWLKLSVFSGIVLLITLILGVVQFNSYGWTPFINSVPIALFCYFSCTKILQRKEIIPDHRDHDEQPSWLKWDREQWEAASKSLGGTLLPATTFKSSRILVPYESTYVGIFLYMLYNFGSNASYVEDEQTIVALAFKRKKHFRFYVRRSAGRKPTIKQKVFGVDDDLFRQLVIKLDLYRRMLQVPLRGVAEIAVLDTLSYENLYGLYPDDVTILRLKFSHKNPIDGNWDPFIYDPAVLKDLVTLVFETLQELQTLGLADTEPCIYEPV